MLPRMSNDWVIRNVEPADAAGVLAAFSSCPEMSRQGRVTNLAEARAYIDWLLAEDREARVAAQPVGGAVFSLVAATLDRANRSAWVFYWAHREARGQGITSRLVRKFADELLGTGVERLELGYRLNNPASARVAEAAGFIVEGIERGKFLIDGVRVDAAVAARLTSDPWPGDQESPQRPCASATHRFT